MRKIVHFIVHSKAAAYIAALLCVVLWLVRVVGSGLGLAGVQALLLCPLAGYLILKVSRDFSLHDVRCTLPATLFFMGCAMAPQIVSLQGELLHLILFPLVCYLLLSTYHKHSAMAGYFVSFALLGVECLLAPPLLLLFPLLVLLCSVVRSLHLRTFFAALWGLLFPYWVVCGVLFLSGNTGQIALYLDRLLATGSWAALVQSGWQVLVPLLWALLLAVPGGVAVLLNRAVKLQASIVFRFLVMAFVVLLVAVALFPALYVALLPCVLLFAALLGSALFVKDGHRAQSIYFLVLLAAWAASLFLVYGVAR